MAEFLHGVNLPWLDYGLDFGRNAWQPRGGIAQPERRQRLRDALGRLASCGTGTVRWWLLGDGRAGLREDGDGSPALDECVFDDMDVAVDELRAAGLRALFVLTDFLWLARRHRFRGVRLGGWHRTARDPGHRDAFVDGVVAPLLRRYGQTPEIVAWDVMNEPEWATLGLGTWDPTASVSPGQMRTFLATLVRAVHRHATQPVTVGLAGRRGLSLVRDLGLDVYQVHWYDAVESPAALATSVEALGLDRPLLLGEYPTRGSALRPAAILEAAVGSGYAGAFAWSALASDAASDRIACETVLATWRSPGGRPAHVAPV